MFDEIKCLLGRHDWRRIGPIRPIEVKRLREFSHNQYHSHQALGKCFRCEKEEMQRAYGSFEWRPYEQRTVERYHEELADHKDGYIEDAGFGEDA